MLNQLLDILKKSNVFLTGRGGVGKSHLTQAVIKHYKSELKNVVVLGSTGIAAVNVGGVSVHSFFKFGICSNLEELRGYDRKQRGKLGELKKMLDVCDLIVIDEISMISAGLMDMIYYRLMSSRFVGRVMLVGDFYQLPPVRKNGDDGNSLFKFLYAFNSSSWHEFEFKNIELVVSKRTKDKKFYDILSMLRVGRLSEEVFSYIENLRVPRVQVDDDTSVLFGRNYEADELNNKMLSKLQAPLERAEALVEIYDENLNENALDRWIANLYAPEILNIKIGAKVIFTVNKWGEYYNGERGQIMQILKENGEIKSVIVQKADGGEIVEVERARFDMSEFVMEGEHLQERARASLTQFPLKLAYAITIHKSQGMSIENLVCDLNHIFANGQLYVALSRAIDPKKLRIFYGKSRPFREYLQSVVKIDEEVEKFYLENKFENIKEDV